MSALTLADTRMYQRKKAGAVPAASQSASVLIAVIEERAPVLAEHVRSVGALAQATAVELGIDGADLESAAPRRRAPRHRQDGDPPVDPPQARTPCRPTSGTLIRQHTLIGERILATSPALEHSAQLVRWSHERIDGSGYPDGLSGDEIPLATRILSVADAFDAMCSDRRYGRTRSHEEALAELRRCAGTQFDGPVVAAFERIVPGLDTPAERPHTPESHALGHARLASSAAK